MTEGLRREEDYHNSLHQEDYITQDQMDDLLAFMARQNYDVMYYHHLWKHMIGKTSSELWKKKYTLTQEENIGRLSQKKLSPKEKGY